MLLVGQSETPPREDPAFWPVRVLNELNYFIVERDHATDRPNVWGVNARELGERFAPYKEHIRKVKTAYEILAFPHCKYEGSRVVIEDELTRDQRAFERDQVELNDAELAILSKLTAARNLCLTTRGERRAAVWRVRLDQLVRQCKVKNAPNSGICLPVRVFLIRPIDPSHPILRVGGNHNG